MGREGSLGRLGGGGGSSLPAPWLPRSWGFVGMRAEPTSPQALEPVGGEGCVHPQRPCGAAGADGQQKSPALSWTLAHGGSVTAGMRRESLEKLVVTGPGDCAPGP